MRAAETRAEGEVRLVGVVHGMRPLVDGEPVTFPGVGGRGDDAAFAEVTWGEERGDADGLMVI